MFSDPGYDLVSDRNEEFNYDYCLPVGCYTFVIYDDNRDGICCSNLPFFIDESNPFDDYYYDYLLESNGIESIMEYFDGYYKASIYGRKEIFSGGEFGRQATESFCGENVCPFATHIPSLSPSVSSLPSSPPTLLSSQNPTLSSAPTFYDCSCEPGQFRFGIQLRTNRCSSEISWELQNGSGDILLTNEIAYSGLLTEYHHDYCLDVGCYDFTVLDSWGSNFFSCTFTDEDIDGYYEGYIHGIKEVFSGGEFGSSETQSFCGEDVCPFTTRIPSLSPSVSSLPSSPPTLLPSQNPTSSSAPTFYDCSCEPGEFRFGIQLKTDQFPWQTSWEVRNGSGDILFTNEISYWESFEVYNHDYCLVVGCYDFMIHDSASDGICCGFGEGYYEGLLYGIKEVFSGGEFGSNEIQSFCGEDVCPFATRIPSLSPSVSSLPSSIPTLLPSQNPTSSSAPTFYDCSCEPGKFKFGIQLKTDQYPWQTSWEVRNGSGDILFTNEIAYSKRFEVYNHDYCLVVGCYDFMINDSASDGICCRFGEGYYEGLLYGIKEVFSGGEFGSNEIQSFCGEDVCPFATRIPSLSPSVSSLPSSSPSTSQNPTTPPTLLPSQNPTLSSAPTFYDCSCEPGEFKFGIQLKTDQYPSETSWEVRNGNGDILFTNEIAYSERFEVYNHDYCLVVGCYDFMIDDSYGDGICCGGYYEGLLYGRKEVFSGAGNFGFNEIQSFCGEDVCA